MKTFKEYLLESVNESIEFTKSVKFTVSDLKSIYGWIRCDRDMKSVIDYVLDTNPDDTLKLIQGAYNSVYGIIQKKTKSKLYFSKFDFLGQFLTYDEVDDWPMFLNVKGTVKLDDGIDLIIHKGGKIEIHEGNEEASPETMRIVNDILGLGDKEERIYGSHGKDVVEMIEKTKKLPIDLYVSPSKKYVEGFWGENRTMFTGLVKLKYINQESTVDWRIIDKNVPISKLKLL